MTKDYKNIAISLMKVYLVQKGILTDSIGYSNDKIETRIADTYPDYYKQYFTDAETERWNPANTFSAKYKDEAESW